ncbi:hypothetical protein B0H16DRAFT_1695644 [Mycena metata]|uniref:Uncharacterized protein n=1 Tax=Mycena metata TaxID=1033252 RepID=A0AAD7I721_9AGAR|nr:hypothetical protein B0H16DRAFT_1695644 [Mycena metata]
MEILATRAEHLVHLRFQHTGGFPSFDLFNGRLPRLERLDLAPGWRPSVALDAPRLHSLELNRSNDLLDLKSALPVARIRTLRFSGSTSGHHLASFERLTSMLSIQTNDPPTLHPVPPPALRSLETWHVELPSFRKLVPHTVTVNFFGRFRTPALNALHIRRLTSAEGLGTDLLRRSECELLTLVLEDPRISSTDILTIFPATPSLHTLAIISGEKDVLQDDFFTALTLQSDPLTHLLPQLQNFRVDGTFEFTTDTLLAMLESRSSPESAQTARLCNIELRLRDRVLPTGELQALIELSGTVSVQYLAGNSVNLAVRVTFG